MVIMTAASLMVAVTALVFAWRMRRENRTLRLAGRAVEAHSLHLEKAVVQLERSLPFDALTGLGNALRLEEDWKRLVARSNRRGEPFSVTLIDVENTVHPGESLERSSLAAIAETLLDVVRAEDHVYRLGQQKFAVLLSGSDMTGARAFIDRTRRKLTVGRPGRAQGEPGCAVTFGVAEWDQGLETLASFLALAAKDRDLASASLQRPPALNRLGRTYGPKTRSAA